MASLMPMTGCKDDAVVDPYDINYVYLRQPNDTYAAVEYKANGQFLSGLTDPLELVQVRLTKPATSNIQVEVTIDPSLVDEYNKAKGTDYTFLSGAEVLNPSMTIAQGTYQTAERIQIGFTDHSGFMGEAKNLILPVVIRSNNGGVTTSKSSRIFLTFNSTYRANIIKVDNYTVTNDIEVEGWQTKNTNVTISNFLNASWAADDPINVNLAIDPSLVAAYNEKNGTAYKTISATLGSSTITLNPGQKTADLALTIGDYTGVANEEEYLIPVKLTMTEGKGAQLSTDVVYVEVTALPKTVTLNIAATTGLTKIEKTADWNLQLLAADGTLTDYNILLDVANYKYVNKGQKLLMDFGTPTKVAEIHFYYYSSGYAYMNFNDIEVSNDGQNWTSWGGCATTSAKLNNYVTFSKPVVTRYIRISGGKSYYDSYGYGAYLKGVYFYN